MNRPLVPLFASLLLAFAALRGSAHAQPSLVSLHPRRVDVDVGGQRGLVRLPLDPAVARAAGPGLARLRLVDAAGTRRPFVVAPSPGAPEFEQRSESLVPLEARSEELPTDPPSAVERYRLPPPDAVPEGTTLALAFEVGRASFTSVAAVTYADGLREELSLFRMPDGTARLELPLRPESIRGPLGVELRTQRGALAPTFRYVVRRPPVSSTEVVRPLVGRAVSGPGGGVAYEVELPVGFVLSALSVTLPGDAAYGVTVALRADDGTDVPLARDPVRARATRTVALPPLVGRTLHVVVEGRSEAPTLAAVASAPSIVFEAMGAGDVGLALVFGGLRDLGERTVDAPAAGIPRAALPLVAHGPDVPNPGFVPSRLFAFAVRPGARVVAARYPRRATLTVPASPDGVVRVVLPPEIAAGVGDALERLRVVDAEGRPYPFVMRDRVVESLPLALRTEPPTAPRTSHFVASLPRGGLEVVGLLVEPGVPSLHRRATVSFGGALEATQVVDLVRVPGDAAPITVSASGQRLTSVDLVVEDGDEAPLRPTLRAQVRLPELVVAAPAGELTVLFGAHDGDDAHEPPAYELAAYLDVLTHLELPEGRLTAVGPNPLSDPPSPWSKRSPLDVVGYVALALVSVALLVYTLRMLRAETGR